jgi:hypothetical protein
MAAGGTPASCPFFNTMDFNRRDFLVTTGVGLFGLFLPRWTKGTWKQVPTTIIKPWDYEIALLDRFGKEITGAGYARLRGTKEDWGGLVQFPDRVEIRTVAKLEFPAAKEGWGTVKHIKIIPRQTQLFSPFFPLDFIAPCTYPAQVLKGHTVQFLPGSVEIYT